MTAALITIPPTLYVGGAKPGEVKKWSECTAAGLHEPQRQWRNTASGRRHEPNLHGGGSLSPRFIAAHRTGLTAVTPQRSPLGILDCQDEWGDEYGHGIPAAPPFG